MNLLFVSPIYPLQRDPRLGIFVHEQAKYLVRLGHTVCVLTLGFSEDAAHEIVDGVRIYRIKPPQVPILRQGKMLWGFSSRIAALHKKHKFHIITGHFVGPLTGLAGVVSKILFKPFVYVAYGMDVAAENKKDRILTAWYLSFADAVVCPSRYTATLAAQHAPQQKITVIVLGVDGDRLKPSMTVSVFKKKSGITNEKILLSVAGLAPRKGQDIILQSLPDVRKAYPHIKYYIIGRGQDNGEEKARLVAITKKLSLEDIVVFIDYVSQSDLANFYHSCDIFVLMSRTIKEKRGIEGLGKAYLEASYCGKPVIGGKSGGTADAIIDGVTGYRLEPLDVRALSKTIITLLASPSLRKKLGAAGKSYITSKLSAEKYAENLAKLYESLLVKR